MLETARKKLPFKIDSKKARTSVNVFVASHAGYPIFNTRWIIDIPVGSRQHAFYEQTISTPSLGTTTAKEFYLGRFGDDPHAFFGRVYSDFAPWEVGGAQPDMARMLEDYPPADPVLDLGSATGDLAVSLALQGHHVVGLEFVQTAVDQARDKAAALPREAGARLRFEVGDATRPSALGVKFGTVLDSGFLHLLEPEEADRFVVDVREAITPGGRYYLHEFSIEFPIENVPRAITEDEIRARFNANTGWHVVEVRSAVFHNRVAQPTAAIVACIEKLAD